MIRNRFDQILQYLYLAHNDNLDKKDKFSKVRLLINYIKQQLLNRKFCFLGIFLSEGLGCVTLYVKADKALFFAYLLERPLRSR